MPLRAGKELSVAATKSFITSLTAGARLVAEWQNDRNCWPAWPPCRRRCARAAAQTDWSAAIEVLAPARNIMVVGRGISFPWRWKRR
jgi:glucosamine--fructose-6-phosphate aminotransferase (isomerizing)